MLNFRFAEIMHENRCLRFLLYVLDPLTCGFSFVRNPLTCSPNHYIVGSAGLQKRSGKILP